MFNIVSKRASIESNYTIKLELSMTVSEIFTIEILLDWTFGRLYLQKAETSYVQYFTTALYFKLKLKFAIHTKYH